MSVTLHTNLGDMKIEVACDLVPKIAKNFIALCASGYYDNTVFHRNVPGFIVQGGDPTGTGKGGESIYGDTFEDEFLDELKHDKRGVVSMANSGPDTNGSQFFIAYARHAHLNNTSSVFGKVIHGMETLDAMERVPVDGRYRPTSDIRILRVSIHANPIAEQES